MNLAIKGGLVGAFAGFLGLLAVGVFQIQSRPVVHALWPMHFVITAANGFGPTGDMIFRTFAFLGNVLLYGGAGYVIGWLIMPKRSRP